MAEVRLGTRSRGRGGRERNYFPHPLTVRSFHTLTNFAWKRTVKPELQAGEVLAWASIGLTAGPGWKSVKEPATLWGAEQSWQNGRRTEGSPRLHAVPFFSPSNWETGVSEMCDRARQLSASRSLKCPNYCGRREKKGTACSLGLA